MTQFQFKLQVAVEALGWSWLIMYNPAAINASEYYSARIIKVNELGKPVGEKVSFDAYGTTPAQAIARAYEKAIDAKQTGQLLAPDVLEFVSNATDPAVREERTREATEFLNCPMCGVAGVFIIDANDPAAGFCMHEKTSWHIKPGTKAPLVKLTFAQRAEFFYQYTLGLMTGNFDYVQQSLKAAEHDAALISDICELHNHITLEPLAPVPDNNQPRLGLSPLRSVLPILMEGNQR